MARQIVSNQSNLDKPTSPLLIETAQNTIIRTFSQTLQNQSPELSLALFQCIFLDRIDDSAADLSMHLNSIVMGQHKRTFIRVIQSVCYIMVNTWKQQQRTEAIRYLFETFEHMPTSRNCSSRYSRRLRFWLRSFYESTEFHTLKTYAMGQDSWTRRYQEYLLVEQYTDSRNVPEHKDSARRLSQYLKCKFQRQLTKYASLASHPDTIDESIHNPTALRGSTIALMKHILMVWNHENHEDLTAQFRKNSRQMAYGQYKDQLIQYLSLSTQRFRGSSEACAGLSELLKTLESDRNNLPVDVRLELKTVEIMLDWLTISEARIPSKLFIQLTSQGYTIALVILLLRLVLVCPQAYTHLEKRLAELIRCYETVEESECQWFIQFLEIFRIVFSMISGSQKYTLIKAGRVQTDTSESIDVKACRIFTQQR